MSDNYIWSTSPATQIPLVVAGMIAFSSAMAASNIEELLPRLEAKEYVEVDNLENNQWVTINVAAANEQQPADLDIVGVEDIIRSIKVALGLPNKDIAQIFGVTRQTIHNYLNNGSQNINQATLARTQQLKAIFSDPRIEFAKSPGAMAKNYVANGESLLSLLSKDDLEAEEILRLAEQLSDRMLSTPHAGSPLPASSERALTELTKQA